MAKRQGRPDSPEKPHQLPVEEPSVESPGAPLKDPIHEAVAQPHPEGSADQPPPAEKAQVEPPKPADEPQKGEEQPTFARGPKIGPRIGDQVIFFDSFDNPPMAAIVAFINPDESEINEGQPSCNLCVLSYGGLAMSRLAVKFSSKPLPGHWSWKE